MFKCEYPFGGKFAFKYELLRLKNLKFTTLSVTSILVIYVLLLCITGVYKQHANMFTDTA